MGNKLNSIEVMQRIDEQVRENNIDLIIHAGDISYAGGDQSIWDSWMRNIAPTASNIPYMVRFSF